MEKRLKIGPQAATDYKRSILPNFQLKKERNDKVEIKYPSFFGPLTQSIWSDDQKMSDKNKKIFAKSRERSDDTEKKISELQKSDTEDIFQDKAQKIFQNKYQSKCREEERVFELALMQQQSCQNVDARQVEALTKHAPQNPFEVQQRLIRSPGRIFYPGSSENRWNRVNETGEKSQKILFSKKILQLEKTALSQISSRIDESNKEEQIVQDCFKKQKDEQHKLFLERRMQNLQKERDLKLGVFGKIGFDKEKGKVERISQTPTQFQNKFPVKYSSQPYITQLKERPMPESEKKLIERLSTPKKQYEPENICERQDFKGLISPAFDKIMCVKQYPLAKQFKSTSSHISKIMDEIQDPTKISSQICSRPISSISSSTKSFKFKSEHLSSFDEMQAQRTQHFYFVETSAQEMVAEIDQFSEKLKREQRAASSRPSTGFCKVTKKQNELYRNLDGYLQVKELKKNELYPRNLIRGLDQE